MIKDKEFYIGDLVLVNPHLPRRSRHPALVIDKSRPDFVDPLANPYYRVHFCGEEAPDERWIPSTLVGGTDIAP